MPISHAVSLLVMVALLAFLTERWRLQPFVAVILATLGFGFFANMSIAYVASAFGIGFSQTLASLGLTVVAAAFMTTIAGGSGATARLAAATAGWRRRGLAFLPLAFLAGAASTPAAAFAVLSPLREALSDGPTRRRDALTLGLGLSAAHGLILPAPVLIAATVILDADWVRVVGIGLPLAVLAIAVGALFARLFAGEANSLAEEAPVASPAGPGAERTAVALLLASLLLVALLIVQSLGDIPSEPFGGGPARNMVIGLGRPLVLLTVGVGILMLAAWRWSRATVSEQGWAGQAVASAAGLLLLVGASGGLQKVLQETGMAELLGEQLLGWPAGLALPFLVAALLKTLQGSSLVAAITAAGMTQPLLVSLGLDGETHRALAVLAIGSGAMTISHINDGFFWLVATGARLRPLQGLALISLGGLVQGLVILAALSLIGLAG